MSHLNPFFAVLGIVLSAFGGAYFYAVLVGHFREIDNLGRAKVYTRPAAFFLSAVSIIFLWRLALGDLDDGWLLEAFAIGLLGLLSSLGLNRFLFNR